MHLPEDALLLRIFIGESDRYRHRPLYEAIVLRARELHLAGATVLRGLMGYRASGRTSYRQETPNVLLPLLVAPNLQLRATRIDFSNTFGDPVRGVSGCGHVTILSQAAAPGIQSARQFSR
jgi:hypothetical protein